MSSQVFSSSTDIISTVETRRLIVVTQGYDDFETFREMAEANLAATRAALA
jgi:hypothetical protein